VCSIKSQPQHGTSIYVRVPLVPGEAEGVK